MEKKVVEYLINLWYSIIRIDKIKGGIFEMYETTLKTFYQEVSGDTSNQEPRLSLALKQISDYFGAWHFYRQLRKIAKKYDYTSYITIDKNICNGKPVIKDTRIQSIHIVKCINRKNAEKEAVQLIKEEYPTLNDEKIIMAILYYIKNTSFKKFISQ